MAKKEKDLTDCLIAKNQECERLKDALKAILMNSIHRDFGKDIMWKSGLLANIRMAFGEEEYNYWFEYYS